MLNAREITIFLYLLLGNTYSSCFRWTPHVFRWRIFQNQSCFLSISLCSFWREGTTQDQPALGGSLLRSYLLGGACLLWTSQASGTPAAWAEVRGTPWTYASFSKLGLGFPSVWPLFLFHLVRNWNRNIKGGGDHFLPLPTTNRASAMQILDEGKTHCVSILQAGNL